MKAASVQFKPKFKKPSENLRSLSKLATEAAEAGADLIVMPELALSGYAMMGHEEAEWMSEELTPEARFDNNSSVGVFSLIAEKYGTHLVWGLVEKDPTTGSLFNSQVIVFPDGEMASYRKVNLFGNDWLWASEGKANPPVVKVLGKRVGLLICRDVRDKKDEAWDSFYEPGDADVVCLSTNWGRGAFPATAWLGFVKDNETSLIVSNRYGLEVPNDFGYGGVCIIKPGPVIQCDGLKWEKDCIVYGEV